MANVFVIEEPKGTSRSGKMALLVVGLAVAENGSRNRSDTQPPKLGTVASEDDTGPRKRFHKIPNPEIRPR